MLHLSVIAKKILRDFWIKHPDCTQQLKAWYKEAESANWKHPNDIKKDYPSASILEDNRVVFNIKGNNYRLIIRTIITIKWYGFVLLVLMLNMIK